MIDSRKLRYAYPSSDPFSLPDVVVAQGGTLLLRGPSGSGKSTWLALAAGLLTPSAGEIVVAGQSVGTLGGAARDAWRARHIGFLPQRLHLSEALTVAENLALACYAAGLPVDQAALTRTLEALGLADLARRRPSQLSGGQAQRAALQLALCERHLLDDLGCRWHALPVDSAGDADWQVVTLSPARAASGAAGRRRRACCAPTRYPER